MLGAVVAGAPLAWCQGGQMKAVDRARAAAGAAPGDKPSAMRAGKVRPAAAKTAAAAAPREQAPGAKRDERRDPFKSPLQKDQAGGATLTFTCGPGIRSIMVGQAEVNGVVKGPTGYLAVVTTTGDRTYFLRPGNEVCNGKVDRITNDSIVFEEKVLDADGRPSTREVIKKLPAEAK